MCFSNAASPGTQNLRVLSRSAYFIEESPFHGQNAEPHTSFRRPLPVTSNQKQHLYFCHDGEERDFALIYLPHASQDKRDTGRKLKLSRHISHFSPDSLKDVFEVVDVNLLFTNFKQEKDAPVLYGS